MATALGAGNALENPWLLDPVSTVRMRAADPPATPLEPEPPADSVETLDLLARVLWILENATLGLTLTELRLMLSEPTDSLQRAVALGLRTRQLRRLGSRSKLRYARSA